MADRKNVSNQGGERSAGEWWRAPDDQQVGRDGQRKRTSTGADARKRVAYPPLTIAMTRPPARRSKDVNSQTRNPS